MRDCSVKSLHAGACRDNAFDIVSGEAFFSRVEMWEYSMEKQLSLVVCFVGLFGDGRDSDLIRSID